MRMDVKLGVVFALVMVLAAGGYFMFRGERQTPISLVDKNVQAIKAQPAKTGTIAKPVVNQPRPPTTNANRPTVTPRPSANNANGAVRPSGPAATPGINKPAMTSPASTGIADATSNPVSRPPVVPASPTSSLPTDSTTVADRPVSGRDFSLTGIPNDASHSPSANPERSAPSGSMTPLSNSPDASAPPPSPTTIPKSDNPLPPGIRTAAVPNTNAPPVNARGLVAAATETHKVQVGDSLSSLAQVYYGNPKYVTLLAEANPTLVDPTRLQLGSLIRIPPLPAETETRTGRTDGTTPIEGKRTYTVKPGDSFYSIAKSQLGKASRWKELLAINNSLVNGDPTTLQPGQRLVLPESR